MLKPFIRPLARQDMLGIWQYTFEAWGISQADSYLKEMASTYDKLAGAPQLGRAADYIQKDIRLYFFKHHIILYQVTETQLDIIRVLHERMDVSRHKMV